MTKYLKIINTIEKELSKMQEIILLDEIKNGMKFHFSTTILYIKK